MLKTFVVALALVVGVATGAAAQTEVVVFRSQLEVNIEKNLLPHNLELVEGNEYVRLLPKLIKAVINRGIRVKYIDPSSWPAPVPDLWGYYNGDEKPPIIYINIRLPFNSQFSALVHELGHHLQPLKLWDGDGRAGQVFAEAFAYLVCKEVGLDTFKSSGGYLQSFQKDFWVLQFYAKEIHDAKEALVKELR
jgi:hypothetical protein